MTASRGNADGGPPPVTFTIDGIEYTVEDRRQPASAILQLAGLDPATYDLLRVVGKRTEKAYEDDKILTIVPGARFISLFTGATPVV